MSKKRIKKSEVISIYDKDIRKNFILNNLSLFQQENSYLISEYSLSNKKSFADLAYFNFKDNYTIGFEIKGNKDSTKRLQNQLETYTSFFNIVYVICTEKHLSYISNFINSKNYCKHVGIIKVDEKFNFTELKKGSYTQPHFDTFLRNLDKEEILSLSIEKGIEISPYSTKPRLVDKLKRHVDYNDIFLHLKNKVVKYYFKECTCGSKLYFNRNNKSYCFICNHEIDFY